MKKTSNRLHSLFAALAALILAAALAVPAFAVEGGFADLYYRMFDDAEVLTEDEDNELEDALEELSLRQSFDVTIATIESMESVGADSMEQFADDLYDYCQYELFTWADVYDTANHDGRRAILQQFIKEIRVRKDYEISIALNASFNQVEQLKAVSTYDGAEIFEEISEKGA